MVDISILTVVYKPAFTSLGGTTLWGCRGDYHVDDLQRYRMDDDPIFQTLSDKNCMIDVSIMFR